ncbi:MAG: hypothetical protein U0Z44_17185 [Kouleothrix sp.]
MIGMAGFQLGLLAGELRKLDPRATPSASTVSQVGGWLLDNLPPLREALAALFAAPAVRRVLGRADADLSGWLQRRSERDADAAPAAQPSWWQRLRQRLLAVAPT